MTYRNGTQYGTAFTVSIEAAEGVTTGISAADRAHTIATAVAHDARPEQIVQPGHVFPIMAQPGGVLVRAGHTEAGCDLTALAGLTPAAVICEVIKDDGTMARLPDLIEFAQQHGLKIGTIADLIHYRSRTESIIERVAERTMQTAHGAFRAVLYRDQPTGSPHIALVRGQPSPDADTPVRVHEPLSVLDLLETGVST
ncbi:bifunctional 3,4-dihydroxy-2-butanone-4-phosphate synthase/GTP cyclohydrolase II, partial [Burkholderia multivorans]